jgi:hypothetical protein
MPEPFIVLIYVLAVARLTGLVVTDTITEGLRDRLIGWLDDRPQTLGSFVATLIQCPWCASIWISVVAGPLVWFWGESPVMLIPALILAFSQVAGMISNLGR